MEVHKYASAVKTISESSLLSMIDNNKIALEGITEHIKRLEAEGIKDNINTIALKSDITGNFVKQVKGRTRLVDYTTIVSITVNKLNSLLIELSKAVRDENEKVWDGKTLTFKQASIMDLIEKVDYWIDDVVLHFDVLLSELSGVHYKKILNKGDLLDLSNHEDELIRDTVEIVLNYYDIIDNLNKVADVEATEENESLLEGSGLLKAVSAEGIGLHKFNPKFWWDLQRSKMHLRKIENLNNENLKISMLINQTVNRINNGEKDPALENAIIQCRESINSNKSTIKRIMAKYE